MNRYQKYVKSEKGKARNERYRSKNKDKVIASNYARHIYQESQQCSIKECDNLGERHHPNYKQKGEIIWLCRKHHLIIHGKIRGKCTKCDMLHYAKGLCKKHYMKKFRNRWPVS